MSKQGDIMGRFGANLAESMGAGRKPRGDGSDTPGLHGATAPPAASRHDGASKLKGGAEIDVERIAPDPDQPRTEFDPNALARLAESLRTHGQIQPIAVRWSEGMGRYLIVSGERRWRAAKLAGRPTLMAVVLDGAEDPGRILEIQLVENCLREDLAPIERARAFQTLMDRNAWSGARLAEALSIDPSSVTRALALLSLPCTVQEAVSAGTLAPSVAYELSKLDDPDEQADVAARVVSGGLSRAEAVEAVRRATPSRSAKAKGKPGQGRAKAVKRTSATLRTASGFRVTVEHKRGVDDAGVRSALAEALAQLEAERGTGASEAA